MTVATAPTPVAPFRLFRTTVRQARRLSPTFVRVTLTGDDLDLVADNGFDQRVKLVVPLPGHGLTTFPDGDDWFARWQAAPEALRNPLRTYTVRAVRPHLREVDLDMVLHGDGGPASAWAAAARPGDVAGLIAPDARHPGPHGGVEFRVPPPGTRVLLAGDETAVPAVLAILERLAVPAQALLEVPHAADALPATWSTAHDVSWLPRGSGAPGCRLVPAVVAAATRLTGRRTTARVVSTPAGDSDAGPDGVDDLWDVAEPTVPTPVQVWAAGECTALRELRTALRGLGLDRSSVSVMGYWRR